MRKKMCVRLHFQENWKKEWEIERKSLKFVIIEASVCKTNSIATKSERKNERKKGSLKRVVVGVYVWKKLHYQETQQERMRERKQVSETYVWKWLHCFKNVNENKWNERKGKILQNLLSLIKEEKDETHVCYFLFINTEMLASWSIIIFLWVVHFTVLFNCWPCDCVVLEIIFVVLENKCSWMTHVMCVCVWKRCKEKRKCVWISMWWNLKQKKRSESNLNWKWRTVVLGVCIVRSLWLWGAWTWVNVNQKHLEHWPRIT